LKKLKLFFHFILFFFCASGYIIRPSIALHSADPAFIVGAIADYILIARVIDTRAIPGHWVTEVYLDVERQVKGNPLGKKVRFFVSSGVIGEPTFKKGERVLLGLTRPSKKLTATRKFDFIFDVISAEYGKFVIDKKNRVKLFHGADTKFPLDLAIEYMKAGERQAKLCENPSYRPVVDREKVSLLLLDHKIRLMIKAGLPEKVIVSRLREGIQAANESADRWEKN